MDVRERDCKGKIVIGVIEQEWSGLEPQGTIIDPKMRKFPNSTHARNVINIIKKYVPNAEIHLTGTGGNGVKYIENLKPPLVNMSLESTMITEGVERRMAKHSYLVTSAGNDGSLGEVGSSSYDFWLAVGAVDDKLNPKRYSSFGKGAVKTVAVTGIHRQPISNQPLNGTSFASPVVVGLLAQWYIWYKENVGIYPSVEATNQFVRQNSHDIWEDGKDLRTGWGLFRLPHRFEATKIIIEPNNRFATKIKYVEGENPVESKVDLLINPIISNDRILIPLRGVNEGLSLTVDWDDRKRQAIVIA